MSVAEEGEHGFIRLADRVPDSPRVDAGSTPHSSLKNNKSGIHVRTDLFVGAYDEDASLHDGMPR